MFFIITLLVGLIGAMIALKLKVPAGAMIGSLFAVAIFNILTSNADLPQSYKIIAQISTGTFIGAKITANDVKGLKNIFLPSLIMVILMGIVNFLMGYFIYKFTPLDMVTALFATAPGGLTDMTIISYDFGADSSKVALLQMVRLISVVSLIPALIKIVVKNFNKSKGNIKNTAPKVDTSKEDTFSHLNQKEKFIKVFITLVIGAIGGVIGKILNIPSGAMTLSMVATAIYNIYSSNAFMPLRLRQLIQVLAGALIGAKMTLGDIVSLKEIFIPVGIVIMGFCLMNLLLGILIYKITDFSVETSLFATAPGGMSDISIIASELGADTPKVATMQFFRLVTVVAIYPIIINIIKDFFI